MLVGNIGEDGVTHINVYSRGKTLTGRFLSNWARSRFALLDHGTFDSVEGYWYWLGTRDERLRSMHGYAAKQLGKSLERTHVLDEHEFRARICAAIDAKLAQRPDMCARIAETTLPYTHYYEYGGKRVDAGTPWLLTHLEVTRRRLRELRGGPPMS